MLRALASRLDRVCHHKPYRGVIGTANRDIYRNMVKSRPIMNDRHDAGPG